MTLQTAPESLFWWWIAERHSIFLKRNAGQSKPWTTDPILRDYKFTNPFRENDRGTVWLRENFLEPHRDDSLELLAFNIAWYRMFNWWGTGQSLGWQTSWDTEYLTAALTNLQVGGNQVFTGAHIIYSPPGRPKIDAIVDVCKDLWELKEEVVDVGLTTKRLQHVFEILQTVHCVGGFMAYEMVSDMRHTRLLEDATDIMTWANTGPGAKRGLSRLGLPCRNQAEGVQSMQILLARANTGLLQTTVAVSLHPRDWPVIEMRDIEHSLCEFDKYCRVKFGEGEPRSKFNGV